MFFYNALCPEVIGVLWRPIFAPRQFSALASEYSRPVQDRDWKSDTLVTVNVNDILREVANIATDVVVDTKVFDDGPTVADSKKRKRKSESSDSDEDEVGED